MSMSESKSFSPKKIWAIGTFRNKNVTFGQNTSGFQDQKQWPPKFQIKFRNTDPPPLFRNHSLKKQIFLVLPLCWFYSNDQISQCAISVLFFVAVFSLCNFYAFFNYGQQIVWNSKQIANFIFFSPTFQREKKNQNDAKYI